MADMNNATDKPIDLSRGPFVNEITLEPSGLHCGEIACIPAKRMPAIWAGDLVNNYFVLPPLALCGLAKWALEKADELGV